MSRAAGAAPPPSRGALGGWLHPGVVPPALLAFAAGYGQFAATATLADVAVAFGVTGAGAERPALAGTTLGLGLAIIRLGSLGALPLASRADRSGRRALVLLWTTTGLVLTATAALAGGFWWFVAILALARPLLSGTNAVAGVVAAEVTTSRDRSKAVSLVGATYAVGAGATVLLRAAAGEALGFRWLFALSLVPLLLVAVAARRLEEPRLFEAAAKALPSRRLLTSVAPSLRPRLILLCVLTGAAAFVTGPANTFVFFFAETTRGLDPAVMATGVLAAGPIGLAGLVAGRWAADRFGRRAGSALALAGVAAAGIATYNVGGLGVLGGYLASMFAASMYVPPSGAISTELFPTAYRSTAAGWITASGVIGAVGGLALFGALGDVFGTLEVAAICVGAPVIPLSALYFRLPETRGTELDEGFGPAAPPAV